MIKFWYKAWSTQTFFLSGGYKSVRGGQALMEADAPMRGAHSSPHVQHWIALNNNPNKILIGFYCEWIPTLSLIFDSDHIGTDTGQWDKNITF